MVLAAVAGAILAWVGYYGRLREPLARLAAFARFVAVVTLLLLLIDPGFVSRKLGMRPLVLLDHSLSMTANGGQSSAAVTLAATLGDTVGFGMLSAKLPGGSSRLAELLNTSLASGRQLFVVTDGEIPDVAAIGADVLSSVGVHTLPRNVQGDIAITEVRGSERLTSGDSLRIEIQGHRTAAAPDTAAVEVRDGTSLLMKGVLRFKSASDTRLELAAKLSANLRGERWLEIRLVGSDSEPMDDVRWWRIVVTTSPGIVVVSTSPDWDGRALYRTLKEVSDAPVAGYIQLQCCEWLRMSDLKWVSAAEVSHAAKFADLLAVRGELGIMSTWGHARLLWAPADDEGDWFVTTRVNSPIGSAFVGVSDDSLPPMVSAASRQKEIGNGWTGMTVRRSRRGAEVPVIGGREDENGRTVWFGIDGLYRWSVRDGNSGQAWRSLVAATANWLLSSQRSDSALARPVSPVTQQGRAVQFHWVATASPSTQEIQLEGPQGAMRDTLRFDMSGTAQLALGVGKYQYHMTGGGSGSFGIEPYSDEFVPSAVTLSNRDATSTTSLPRRSWRELWWLFAVSVTGFGVEWLLRRRMGAL